MKNQSGFPSLASSVVGAILMSLVLNLLGCSSLPQALEPGSQTAGNVSFGSRPAAANSRSNPKDIVFIHGMFMTPKSWQAWLTRFSNLGYKVAAPAWPLHEGTVESLRSPEKLAALGQLEFSAVLDHYRQLLKARLIEKKAKLILIGHSMGGLIAQILLSEGLADAAIAIDSAPPKGLISLKYSFLKSNWGVISPFAKLDEPIVLDLNHFSYAFANAQPNEEQLRLYNEYYVPESRRVGKGPTTEFGKVDFAKSRGPLLILAGAEDNIIPATLNFKNFNAFEDSSSYTEFAVLAGRDHSTVLSAGWENVAEVVNQFLQRIYP